MNSKERYSWSLNGEEFTADSLQELIKYHDLSIGSIVHVGRVQEHGTRWIDANDVIDMIGERGSDVGGDFASNFPDVSSKAKVELQEFLDRWQAENCVASFFNVVGVRQHTITRAELVEAGKLEKDK